MLVVAGPGVDPILNCVNATGNGPGDRQTGRQADRQTDSGRKRPTALDNDSLCTCPCVTNSRLPRQARDKSNATKIDQKSRTLFDLWCCMQQGPRTTFRAARCAAWSSPVSSRSRQVRKNVPLSASTLNELVRNDHLPRQAPDKLKVES